MNEINKLVDELMSELVIYCVNRAMNYWTPEF